MWTASARRRQKLSWHGKITPIPRKNSPKPRSAAFPSSLAKIPPTRSTCSRLTTRRSCFMYGEKSCRGTAIPSAWSAPAAPPATGSTPPASSPTSLPTPVSPSSPASPVASTPPRMRPRSPRKAAPLRSLAPALPGYIHRKTWLLRKKSRMATARSFPNSPSTRLPTSRPFPCATASSPLGVRRCLSPSAPLGPAPSSLRTSPRNTASPSSPFPARSTNPLPPVATSLSAMARPSSPMPPTSSTTWVNCLFHAPNFPSRKNATNPNSRPRKPPSSPPCPPATNWQ